MISGKSVLLASLAVFLTTGVVETLTANTDAAYRAVKAAEAAVARGDYRAAESSLSSIKCQGNAKCETLVTFTRAWVYESWSKIPSENSSVRLSRALKYYQRVSKANPGNAQILTNLALTARRVGDTKTAIDAMWKAIKLDPKSAYKGYLFLGDVWQSVDENGKALHNYKLAIEKSPIRSEGHQRLLDFYRKTRVVNDLFEHSMGIRQNLPSVAATGFEYAIRLLYKTDVIKTGESLARWTAIQANLGALSAANLKRLPSPQDWNFLGAKQLQQMVSSEKWPPSNSSLSWWEDHPVRQDAMSRLLRLKATRLITAAERSGLSSGDRRDAQRNAINYLTAAVEIAPKYYAYLGSDLAESSNTKLDAATSLVTLHHSLKAGSDPIGLSGISEQELKEMTTVLFDGKGGAYAAGQLKDIQRYHTVIGLIYYETKRDTSGGADNATFQLQHALRTADRIARKNPRQYEPLPELRMLLADVYQRQGKTQDSGREFLAAAMGFLEKDNLRNAGKALDNAKQRNTDITAVASVLQGRKAVQAEGAALLKAQPGGNTVRLDPKLSWLQKPETLNLPERFIEGQKFKILTDLSKQIDKTEDKALANSVNELALEAASKNKVLTSPSDVMRIQQLEVNIRQSNIQSPIFKPVQIEGIIQPKPAQIEQLSWTLPSQQGPVQIKIDPQILDNRLVLDKDKIQNQLKIDRNQLQVSPGLSQ